MHVVCRLSAANMPGAHGTHSVAPLRLYVPAGHSEIDPVASPSTSRARAVTAPVPAGNAAPTASAKSARISAVAVDAFSPADAVSRSGGRGRRAQKGEKDAGAAQLATTENGTAPSAAAGPTDATRAPSTRSEKPGRTSSLSAAATPAASTPAAASAADPSEIAYTATDAAK